MIHREFQIEIFSLPSGEHFFSFEKDASFFQHFNNQDFDEARLQVNITVYKTNLTQESRLNIRGTFPVFCNRCNARYSYPLDLEQHLVVKKGNPADSTDEVIFVDPQEESVDFSQHIYESVITALPGRYVPCLDNPEFLCNKEVLTILRNIETDKEPEEKEQLRSLGETHSEIFKKLSQLHKN